MNVTAIQTTNIKRGLFGMAALALWLSATPVWTTVAAASDSGWWVILGSVSSPDNNFTPQVEAAARRLEAQVRRCGLKPFQDFSSKFRDFTPGYTVVVAGPYTSKVSADQVLAKVRGCVAGAYVKHGVYAGE